MKYLAIDIETTGLEESWCQTLEIAAILADTADNITHVEKLPSWTCRLFHKRVIGQPYALWLNAELIKDMDKAWKDVTFATVHNYISPEQVFMRLQAWVQNETGSDYKRISGSGKNFGIFDARFLWALPGWQREELLKHRELVPAQAFFRPADDEEIPDLKTCIERAGLDYDAKKHHTALYDARMVVELNRAGDGYLLKRLLNHV